MLLCLFTPLTLYFTSLCTFFIILAVDLIKINQTFSLAEHVFLFRSSISVNKKKRDFILPTTRNIIGYLQNKNGFERVSRQTCVAKTSGSTGLFLMDYLYFNVIGKVYTYVSAISVSSFHLLVVWQTFMNIAEPNSGSICCSFHRKYT